MRVKEWQGEVVFLHEVVPGAADRSYGIQVAQLAGLPAAVVARAEEVLAALEQGEQSGAVTRLADDLPLFAAAPARPAGGSIAKAADSEVEKALASVNPDELTPKQALEFLYALRARTTIGVVPGRGPGPPGGAPKQNGKSVADERQQGTNKSFGLAGDGGRRPYCLGQKV